MTPLDVRRGLDAFGGCSVDDAEYSPALLCLSDDHLHRIGGGAEDVADLGGFQNPILDVDGKAAAQRDYEEMAGADGGGVGGGNCLEFVVIAVDAGQACARCLVECDAELHLRHGVHDGFVDVFDGLDEMTVADDDISVRGDFQADGVQVHDVH